MSIRDIIEKEMHRQGVTAIDISKRTPLHAGNIYRFLNGSRSLGVSSVEHILDALNLEVRPKVKRKTGKITVN